MSDDVKDTVLLTGEGLTLVALERLAERRTQARYDENTRRRIKKAQNALLRVSRSRPIYGLSTGVGAKRFISVGRDTNSCLQLWRSHALNVGAPVDIRRTRAMLAIRANQIAKGGAGVSVELADALLAVLLADELPAVTYGASLGTADLAALSTTALYLVGERGTQLSSVNLNTFNPNDALPFMSSSALTLADAAITLQDMRRSINAAIWLSTILFTELGGNAEHISADGLQGQTRGVQEVAASIRDSKSDRESSATRIQDPFCLRLMPQSLGTVVDAWRETEGAVVRGVNGAHENPLLTEDPVDVRHVGNFYMIELALAAEKLCSALAHEGSLLLNRISLSMDGRYTGVDDYLTDGTPGASGAMMLEYSAASSLAEIRTTCNSTASYGIHISQGAEEHAPFTPLAIRRLSAAHQAYTNMAACLLVAISRLLALKDPTSSPTMTAMIPSSSGLSDRNLTPDIREAIRIVSHLAVPTLV
ncbi:aromatic amino acid lyase [Rhodococcus sp. NPDC055024]